MKTAAILASTLGVGSALAVPLTTRSDERPFKMLVQAEGQSFDQSYLQASESRFWIGKATDSSCGAVTPTFTYALDQLTTYGNGRQNVQIVAADISGASSGLLIYISYPYTMLGPNTITMNFTRTDGELFYQDSTWLACPQQTEGQYSVYPEKAYSHEVGKDKCLPFTIKTDVVKGEVTPCELY